MTPAELCEEHFDLAEKVAAYMSGRVDMAKEDRYSVALEALWDCCNRYDPDLRVDGEQIQFSTFAFTRMKGAIIDEWRRLHKNIKRNSSHSFVIGSLDEELALNDDHHSTRGDILVDDRDSMTVWWEEQDEIALRDNLDVVLATLARLPLRDQEICKAHLKGQTLASIGLDYGLTESRIAQIWMKWIRGLAPPGQLRRLHRALTAT